MEPEQFAEILRKAMDAREASWNGTQYRLDWHTAIDTAGCPKDWHTPVHLLLFTGYCDIWDWCDVVAGIRVDA